MPDELEPFELSEARLLIPMPGNNDPEDLEYGGFLNLVGGRGADRPCSLHPNVVVSSSGCKRCHEVRRVRCMLGALAVVPALVDAYERFLEVGESDDEGGADALREIDELLDQLGIVRGEPGEEAAWNRQF